MKKLLFAALLLTLFAASCKKKNTETICRPVKIVQYGNDSNTITYDAQHRILDFTTATYTIQTTYAGLTASSTNSYTGTALPYYTLYLNSNSNIQSMERTYAISGTTYHTAATLKYDDAQHLIWTEQVTTDGSGGVRSSIDSMIYENGNLTTKYTLLKPSTAQPYYLLQRTVYTYTNKPNKTGYFTFFASDRPVGGGLDYYNPVLGKTSDNLINTAITYDGSGVQGYESDYSYTLNSEGYVTEQNVSVIVNPGPYTQNTKFYYNCE